MNEQQKVRALVYCRVSSDRQATEGHGLDSQEHRCREYAKLKGYEVEQVFRDSFSGGGDFMLRPAMKELLSYADSKPYKDYAVIFDDLKRFARDTEFHLKLRASLKMRNIKPECLNYTFEDTPEGRFVETVFAAQGQLEREQNKRQVIQKQRARLEKGYWPFFPPPGYHQVKDPIHGKLLTPVEPEASLIKEALEGFASERFLSPVDVLNFLRSSNYKVGNGKHRIYLGAVIRILRRVVYAGYVERKEWDVSRRKGHHEALVSLETFEKVQAKLDGKLRTKTRKSDRLDFVLRGFLLCTYCRHPMTASWSRGRSKPYRYYRCVTRNCVRYNKSINGNFVDKEFDDLLRSTAPKQGAVELARAIVADLWGSKVNDFKGRQDEIEKRLAESRRQVDALVERVVKTTDDSIVSAYEDQIRKCKAEGQVLQEQLKSLGSTAVTFETALGVVLEFLKNPLFIWGSENINAKRLVMRLVFAEKLAFHPELGFETAQKSLLVGLFEQIGANKSQDVEMAKIEFACNKALRELLRSVVRFKFL